MTPASPQRPCVRERTVARALRVVALAVVLASLTVAEPLRAGDGAQSAGAAARGEIHGGRGGDAFQDEPAGRLATIWVRAGRWVDAIGCAWTDGDRATRSPWHGGTGGEIAVIQLDPGESVTRVRGIVDSQGYIGSLSFETTRERTWGPFGDTLDGPAFDLDAGPGAEICGFRGRSAGYLDALGVLVRPSTAGSAPTTAQQPSTETAPDPPWLRERLEQVARRDGLPSLAAALVLDGKVVAASACGVRMVGAKDPVRTDDAYLVGSVTKPMTATLVGRCVDRGVFRLDTTVAELFPEWKTTMRPEYRKVTVAQLLAHMGGLPGEPSVPQAEIDAQGDDPSARRYAYAKAALSDPSVAEPGTKAIYGGGAVVVTAAIERATKRSYEELLRDEVFVPLGMTTAGFGDMATPGRVDGVWGHRAVGDRVVPVTPKPEEATNTRIPVGGVHCSVGDLARWAAAFLGPQRGARPYLRAETLRSLAAELRPGTGQSPAWAVAAVPWAKGQVLWHNGSQGRNYALAHVAPEEAYATCVATNVAGLRDARADRACQEIHLFLVEHVRDERKRR